MSTVSVNSVNSYTSLREHVKLRHEETVKELERRYKQRIDELLEMKAKVLIQIQQRFYEKLEMINNLIIYCQVNEMSISASPLSANHYENNPELRDIEKQQMMDNFLHIHEYEFDNLGPETHPYYNNEYHNNIPAYNYYYKYNGYHNEYKPRNKCSKFGEIIGDGWNVGDDDNIILNDIQMNHEMDPTQTNNNINNINNIVMNDVTPPNEISKDSKVKKKDTKPTTTATATATIRVTVSSSPQPLSFSNKVKEKNDTNNTNDVNIMDRMDRMDTISAIDVLCICNSKLIKTDITSLLESYPEGLMCDKCNKAIGDITYHCPKDECKQHKGGYDICVKCATNKININNANKTKTSNHKKRRKHMANKKKKQFKCNICGNKFTTKSNMSIHLRLHSGSKPYKCTKCSKRFTQNSQCKSHTKRHHR